MAKSMILALILSFFILGIGIIYAGNLKLGAAVFLIQLICLAGSMVISVLGIIAFLVWIAGLYFTYQTVNEANA